MMTARRIVEVFFALLLLAALGFSQMRREQRSATTLLALVAPSDPQPPTDIIDIELTISDAADLAAFEFDLVYDPNLVTVAGLTLSDFLGQTVDCTPNTERCAGALGPFEQAATTSLGGYSYGTGGGANENGLVATIRLQPTGETGTTLLQLTNALVVDVNGAPTAPMTQDVTLVIADPTVTPTSTATYTPTVTYTPTPTSTNTATPMPTPVSTNTATPMPTPTSTYTPTPMPFYRLYLPVVVDNTAAGTIAGGNTQGIGAPPPTPPAGAPETISGNTDVNEDGFTNVVDVQLVAAAWGATPADPDWNPAYDFNGDLLIDWDDILVVVDNWRVPAVAGFTPESASVGALVSIIGSNFTLAGNSAQVVLNQQGGGSTAAPVMGFSAGVITFTIPTGAATGPLTITIGSQTMTTAGWLTILPASDFALTAAPEAASVIRGQSVNYVVNLTSLNSFGQLATLEVAGVPSGVAAAFDPPQITAGQFAMLSITVPISQPLTTTPLSIAATANVNGITVTQATSVTLSVQPVTTAFLGQAVIADVLQTPLAGVTITMLGRDGNGNPTGCTGETVSDAAGNFALTNLPNQCAGGQLIRYDGMTVTNAPGDYAGVDLFYNLTLNQVTVSPVLIHLPRIDNAETVQVQQDAPVDQFFSFTTIPNLTVTVYAHTTFTLLDGSVPDPFPLIAIQVPVDRLPDTMPPMPDEITPFIVAFQPANATASQPVAVSFPNLTNVSPGTNMPLTTLDPTKGIMVMYGTGTVSNNGTQVIPDFDPAYPGHRYGLVHFDWHGPGPPSPDVSCGSCKSNCCGSTSGGAGGPGGSNGPPSPSAGKPVDLASGIEMVTETDIAIRGGRGTIAVIRTYRTFWNAVGPFGVGTNHNYGYRVDTLDPQNAAMINLIMPHGDPFPFVRQPDGTLTNETLPSMQGVVMTVQDGKVYIRWKDGAVYEFVFGNFQFRYVLNSITDTNGNTVTLVRNPSRPNQITEIIDPVGRKLILNYDGADRITSIADPIGRTVYYTYNTQGTLASVTNPEGGVTQYSYDGQNRLLTATDAREVVIASNTYDANGRVIEQVQADGSRYQFAYTLLNPLVSSGPVLQTVMTDPLGRQTTYRFNPEGLLTDITDLLGQTRIFELESGTNQLLAIQGTGTCQACVLPGAGDHSYTYDANGNVLTETDALGNTTTYAYDPVFNKVTSITDPLGHTTTFTYDVRGNLLTQTDENGHTTSYTYDQAGLLTAINDPLNQQTTLTYDAFGNLVAITNALGHTTSFGYDAVSRQVGTTDALGRSSQTVYDALDRVVLTTDPLGNATHFTYDPMGNLLGVTDALNHSTTFDYDLRNRLKTRTTELGYFETYTYDLASNLTIFVDRRGQTSQYTYDPLDRLVEEQYEDGSRVSYVYDAYGRLVWADDSAGGLFSYAYDLAGRTTTTAGPFGAVEYTYDPLGQVLSRQVMGQPPVDYSYDPTGNLLSATMPQAGVTYAYDPRNLPLMLARSNGVTTTYSYDALGQVLSIIHANSGGVLNTQTYTYDASGNRTSSTTSMAQTLITEAATSQYDAQNRLVSRTTTAGTTIYAYDANGNLISESGPQGMTSYTWDGRNRLVTINQPGGTSFSLHYDFAGNLINQQTSGPELNLSQNLILDELTNVIYESNNGGKQFSILTGQQIDEHMAVIQTNGQVEFALTDGLNSTIATVDGNGAINSQFFYEPYGQTTAAESDYPFQYTGRVPVLSSLYYYRARYYDSLTTRFISEDPIGFSGGDVNFYSYVKNDPINFVDPSGHFKWSFFFRFNIQTLISRPTTCGQEPCFRVSKGPYIKGTNYSVCLYDCVGGIGDERYIIVSGQTCPLYIPSGYAGRPGDHRWQMYFQGIP
jgi:RHS repeat-associated protein